MIEEMYDPLHFEETIEEGGISFRYKILPGPARTRTAIALLEINGASAEIVKGARERAAQLDSIRSGWGIRPPISRTRFAR